MNCLVPDCKRAAKPEYARCESHVQLLTETLFGGTRKAARTSEGVAPLRPRAREAGRLGPASLSFPETAA